MKRSLNQREKRLLLFCLTTIFLVINFLALREFTLRRADLTKSVQQLELQAKSNNGLLRERPFYEKRLAWLEKMMPYTDSAGKSQGQLLEDLQTAALDNELKITSQTLLEPVELDHCNEVAVSIRIHGDQDKLMRWLLTLQSPEKFQAIKSFDLQPETKTKAKTPQAECNLTIARWFNSEAPANAVPAEPMKEPEPASPLETPSAIEAALAPPEKV